MAGNVCPAPLYSTVPVPGVHVPVVLVIVTVEPLIFNVPPVFILIEPGVAVLLPICRVPTVSVAPEAIVTVPALVAVELAPTSKAPTLTFAPVVNVNVPVPL